MISVFKVLAGYGGLRADCAISLVNFEDQNSLGSGICEKGNLVFHHSKGEDFRGYLHFHRSDTAEILSWLVSLTKLILPWQ